MVDDQVFTEDGDKKQKPCQGGGLVENLERASPCAGRKAIPHKGQDESYDPEDEKAKRCRSVRNPQPMGSAEEDQGKYEQHSSNPKEHSTSEAVRSQSGSFYSVRTLG
jgi:hypothetical protein